MNDVNATPVEGAVEETAATVQPEITGDTVLESNKTAEAATVAADGVRAAAVVKAVLEEIEKSAPKSEEKPILFREIPESMTINKIGAFYYPIWNGSGILANYATSPTWQFQGHVGQSALRGRSVREALDALKEFNRFLNDEVGEVTRDKWVDAK